MKKAVKKSPAKKAVRKSRPRVSLRNIETPINRATMAALRKHMAATGDPKLIEMSKHLVPAMKALAFIFDAHETLRSMPVPAGIDVWDITIVAKTDKRDIVIETANWVMECVERRLDGVKI